MKDIEKYKFHDKETCEHFVEFINRNEIDAIVESLAHTISTKYKGEDLILVSILKGSMQFLSDLVKKVEGVVTPAAE